MHWYKDAVIYQLHVKAFKDSDNDGVGDFRGLTEKLDYIADLGVNVIWLLPFYPSPMRDDGYDVADYRGIHGSYGTRADFRRFIRQAHRRSLRVITELVVNHTSDQHPWFQASRRAPRGSVKRNYYVWSDTDSAYAGTRMIFTDTETSNWAWDPVAQQYYWHRFFSHQPDLNFDNPSVVKAVIRVMRFWLDMGVDGLRLDAIPYLCERKGTSNENLPETHAVLKHMRAVVDAHYQDRVLLAEANQWPEDVLDYFGDGDECHMAYHFPLMPRMYMAIAQEDRHPIVEIMDQTPAIPESCQWAIFLRNHDELTLEMVTDEERDYMYQIYARDPRTRINAGIRRRLAPLMSNDPDRLKLLNSLLLSMPGSPILYYGDEIGMGDNIFLGDRNGVRTPMQWSPERNAGFSRADPQQLYLPPIMDPVYGYEAVNVEAQSRDVYSLLNWTRRLIAVRQSSLAFGRGSLTFLSPGNRRVLAYVREHGDETILCVANLSHTAQPVELDLARFQGRVPLDMMGRSPFPPVGELPYLLTLARHGFFWFRLTTEAEVPDWHVEALPRRDLVTLVLRDGWQAFFPERLPRERQTVAASMLAHLTQRTLPAYLRAARLLAEVTAVTLQRRLLWHLEGASYLLLWADARAASGVTERYFLPLAVAWGGDASERIRELLPMAVARVREHSRMGVLYEAQRDGGFCAALTTGLRRGGEVELEGCRLCFTSTRAAPEILAALDAGAEPRPPTGQAPAGLVHLGAGVSLQLCHRESPESYGRVEMSRHLTERSGFRKAPRLAGFVELADGERRSLLAVVEERLPNQGDGWSHMMRYLESFLDEAQLRPMEDTRRELDVIHAGNETLLESLGRCVGELHRTLAEPTDDPAFQPEPLDAGDLVQRAAAAGERAVGLLQRLQARLESLPELERKPAAALLSSRERLMARLQAERFADFRGSRIRGHGALELSRVLVTGKEFLVTGFAGDRRKQTPLEDVASMLCSLQRAAQQAAEVIGEIPLGDPEAFRGFMVEWLGRAERAFLRGYREAAGEAGLYGPTTQDGLAVVELFVLEWLLIDLDLQLAAAAGRLDLPIAALLHHLASE